MVIKVRKTVGRDNTNAIKPPNSKQPSSSSSRWFQASLPFLAGLLHLQVVSCCIHSILLHILPNFSFFNYSTASTVSSTSTYLKECYNLDRAVFFAYLFDLVCCYLNIIPFSRCNSSKDIVVHHAPTLMLALPLAVPLWANLPRIDPIPCGILNGDDPVMRNQLMDAFVAASAFAYVSSLNEVIMCFQRVEMTLQGITTFRDIPMMKRRLFTSRVAIGFELCYKLFFFWGISILACKACCEMDMALYDAIASAEDYDEPIWKTIFAIYSSPGVLRGALFRAFSVLMYPSMGMRCFKKIRTFLKEGETL